MRCNVYDGYLIRLWPPKYAKKIYEGDIIQFDGEIEGFKLDPEVGVSIVDVHNVSRVKLFSEESVDYRKYHVTDNKERADVIYNKQ